MAKYLLLLAKCALTGFLAYFVYASIDTNELSAHIGSHKLFLCLGLMVGIGLLQSILCGYRLSQIMTAFGHTLSVQRGAEIWYVGGFFSQLLFSFVGGDALRVWSIMRTGVRGRAAAGAILLDRASGFISLIFMFLLALPWLLALTHDRIMQLGLLAFAVFCLAGLATFFLLPRHFKSLLPTRLHTTRLGAILLHIAEASAVLTRSYRSMLFILLLGVVLHVSNMVALWSILSIYGASVSLASVLVVTPAAWLLAQLPISIAGWGVREAAMIAAFALVGVPSELVTAGSITYGIGLLVAFLPGVPMLMIARKHRAAVQPTPQAQGSGGAHLHGNKDPDAIALPERTLVHP